MINSLIRMLLPFYYILSLYRFQSCFSNCLLWQFVHVSRQVRQRLSTTGLAKHGTWHAMWKPSLCQPLSGFATAECWKTMKRSILTSCLKTATFRYAALGLKLYHVLCIFAEKCYFETFFKMEFHYL